MASEKYFQQVASQWDQMRAAFFSESVRDKALAAAGVRAGAVAADVGAGTGFLTEALLKAGLKVVAVDQSAEMLAQLRAKVGPGAAVDCRLGSSGQLPLADGEVDFALANMYLHHVDDPAAAIAELARVLKPGGALVITDLDEHRHDFLLREHHDRWPGFKRPDVLAWLTQAGLHETKVDCAGENCCAASSCGRDRAQVSIFIAQGRK